jgi:hypothetical protein
MLLVLVSVESAWHQYCSKIDDKTPSRAVEKFHAKLFRELVSCLGIMPHRILRRPPESLVYVELRKVHMSKLCYYFDSQSLVYLVQNLVNYPKILRFNPELHYFHRKFHQDSMIYDFAE